MSILDEAVAAAGVDPRELHGLLMAGRQSSTIELARAFEDAARSARDGYERGRRAHRTIADGLRNDGGAVLDAAEQDGQAWRLLGQGGQDMEDTASFLKRSVSALDDAQATSTRVLNRMTGELNALAAAWNRQVAADPTAPADRQQLIAQAATVVRGAAVEIQRAIDTYDSGLTRDASELARRGYPPAAGPVPGAMYAGGPLAAPTGPVPLGFPPPGTDPYRGLSPANGLFTAGDVAGGFYGAKLEVDSHFRTGHGQFVRDGAEAQLARLRGQERVLDRAGFYRELDDGLARLRQGDDLLRSGDDLARTSKSLPIKVGGTMALAGIGYDIATGKDPVQAVAAGGGGFLASIAAGAATGAVVGSFVPIPGVGTAAGAIVGAGVGIFTSGAIDSLFENGPDVGAALDRGAESVVDTGKAIGDGVVSVGKKIGGLFD
jgi:hypothetical protein